MTEERLTEKRLAAISAFENKKRDSRERRYPTSDQIHALGRVPGDEMSGGTSE